MANEEPVIVRFPWSKALAREIGDTHEVDLPIFRKADGMQVGSFRLSIREFLGAFGEELPGIVRGLGGDNFTP